MDLYSSCKLQHGLHQVRLLARAARCYLQGVTLCRPVRVVGRNWWVEIHHMVGLRYRIVSVTKHTQTAHADLFTTAADDSSEFCPQAAADQK